MEFADRLRIAFTVFLIASACDLPTLNVLGRCAGDDITTSIDLKFAAVSQQFFELLPTSLHARLGTG